MTQPDTTTTPAPFAATIPDHWQRMARAKGYRITRRGADRYRIVLLCECCDREHVSKRNVLNRHISASASSGSAGATCSTMALRWVSRSVTSALRFFQVMKLRARAMLASRLVISLAASLGLWAPASASRSLRWRLRCRC